MQTAKRLTVLGVNHKVQGDSTHPGTFEDPDYLDLLAFLVPSNNIDFVGEECKGNPTHAKRTAQELLGEGHYANVDPLCGPERDALGIGGTGGMYPRPSPAGGEYSVNCEVVSEQGKREAVWVDRIVQRTKSSGLLICGHLHALSVAFRLQSQGHDVNVRVYLPISKLCGH